MGTLDNIIACLKQQNKTQKDLTNHLGLSNKSFTAWKSGLSSSYNKYLPQISEFLGVSIDYLLGKSDEAQFMPSDINNSITLIPIYESISAGYGAYADSKVIDYIPMILVNEAEKDDYFSVRVKGDSMSPRIEDGDIIIVKRQSTVEDGQIAAVMVGDEGFVKRVFFGKNKLTLRSYNPEYEDRVYEGSELEQVRICGLVKSIHTDL